MYLSGLVLFLPLNCKSHSPRIWHEIHMWTKIFSSLDKTIWGRKTFSLLLRWTQISALHPLNRLHVATQLITISKKKTFTGFFLYTNKPGVTSLKKNSLWVQNRFNPRCVAYIHTDETAQYFILSVTDETFTGRLRTRVLLVSIHTSSKRFTLLLFWLSPKWKLWVCPQQQL